MSHVGVMDTEKPAVVLRDSGAVQTVIVKSVTTVR